MRWAWIVTLWMAPMASAQVAVDIADGAHTGVSRALFALDEAALQARLAELTPDRPEGYFLLAEEVADGADSPERLSLARRLLALALALDRSSPAPRVAGPACRALASLATSDADRLWLEAVARRFDSAAPLLESSGSGREGVPPDVAHRAATAFGLARSGRAHMAERYLEDPEVVALIQRYDDVLRVEGLPGAMNWLEEQIETWPLSAGSLDRVERVRGASPPRYRFDQVNHGNPGPALTDRELVAFLRLESRLLSGIHRSWSAQIAADLGAPLRDADPDAVVTAFGVDATKTLYREGAWVTPEEAAALQSSPRRIEPAPTETPP